MKNKQPLDDIRLFLLDMDGTFYLGEQLIEGSLDFIEKVRASGREYLFLTNNSSHNADFYRRRLARMGLETDLKHILTSGEATADLIKERYPGKKVFLLGNEFLREDFEQTGVCLSDTDAELVVIGFDTSLTYERLRICCDYLRKGLPYIASHPDFNCPTETGFMPDIGAMIAFIDASVGRKPDLIVGKPYSGIVEAAKKRSGYATQEMAMVGDRLYTDIRTGLENNMLSILVLSGETDEDMLKSSPYQPDLCFNRLSEMIPLL